MEIILVLMNTLKWNKFWQPQLHNSRHLWIVTDGTSSSSGDVANFSVFYGPGSTLGAPDLSLRLFGSVSKKEVKVFVCDMIV